MRLILTVTLLASTATVFPQSLVNPTRAAQLAQNFESRKDDQPLHCEVTPIQPQLNFSFRFQAGYVFRVPMKQFAGAGHRWSVLTRVTPSGGGDAALLSARFRLPSVPKNKSVAEWGGHRFVLGHAGQPEARAEERRVSSSRRIASEDAPAMAGARELFHGNTKTRNRLGTGS